MARRLAGLKHVREAIQRAEKDTVDDFLEGSVQQEAEYVERLIVRIQDGINAIRNPQARWSATTLTSRGRGSQESEMGADFVGVFNSSYSELPVRKGFLVQAKLERDGEALDRGESDRLAEQCQRMLDLTDQAFVLTVGPGAPRISRAQDHLVGGAQRVAMGRSYGLPEFFSDHFSCRWGDRRLTKPGQGVIQELRELMRANRVSNGLSIAVEKRL